MILPFKFSAAIFAGALLVGVLPVRAQQITTIAGTGGTGFSGDGGAATQATFNDPVWVTSDLAGNLYIADQNNNRIRRVDTKGVITTVAGNGSPGFSGDGGPAIQASINLPTGVCTDAAGNLYINDLSNFRIRKVDTSGNISTVAGNGVKASTGDGGPATQASMYLPIRCAVDSLGNLYITDQGAHKIRKIDPSGTISTFAGTGAHLGVPADFSGDGGPAIAADLNNPTAIALDPAGNVYFSDQFNQRIRKIDKSGIITTIAGVGAAGYTGDNVQATGAAINYPGSIVLDQNGDIYFCDSANSRVRKISNGVITTVAGNGSTTFAGDGGPAASASLNNPFGLAMDAAGNLYIDDIGDSHIRKVSGATVTLLPNFTAAAVTNGASFKSGLTAGALMTIFGVNLSNNVHGNAAFGQVPLPTTLASSRVLIAGTAIPLFNVINIQGTEQINAQVPFELAGQQTVNIVIDNGRGISTPVQVAVAAAQPGIFLEDGIVGAFLHGADNSVVTGSKPASAGEIVVVFCTGLGAVTPAGTTGALASGLSTTNVTPTVAVGGTTANLAYNGLAPGLVGLYQINFTVPQSTPSGSIDVVVTANGVASNTAKLPVK